jgi:hypothetical protein
MKLKSHFLGACALLLLSTSCGDSGDKKTDSTSTTTASTEGTAGTDPKGIGPHTNVQLSSPLDESMVSKGSEVYNVKCASCHKLSEEKMVGPGWKGVTDRRTPEWIMNFITNTDVMIEKDTAAQNMLEICLVKMPNQNVPEADARAILEFMRKNDGKK